MQEKHADNAVTGFIKHKEVHKSVLMKTRNQELKTSVRQTTLTTEAAKEPFNQRRRCPMSSTAVSGTSVSALLGLT